MQFTLPTTVNKTPVIKSKPVPLYCPVMKFSFCIFLFIVTQLTEGEQMTKQAVFQRKEQKYLANHVIASRHVKDELKCAFHCIEHDSCASVNYKISGASKGLCELNNETTQKTSDNDELRTNPEFVYLYILKKVRKIWLYFFF